MTTSPSPIRPRPFYQPEGIPFFGTILYNALSATGLFGRYYESVANDIFERCPRGDILDVGTGPGRLLIYLRQMSPDLRLTGVDISPAMTKQAVRNIAREGLTGIDIRVGKAAELPFPDCAFDLAVSSASMHHWKDPVAGVNEMHRVLKPGGLALIYDLMRDVPPDVSKGIVREYGRLAMIGLGFAAIAERHRSVDELKEIARISSFGGGTVRFVSVLGCLELIKRI